MPFIVYFMVVSLLGGFRSGTMLRMSRLFASLPPNNGSVYSPSVMYIKVFLFDHFADVSVAVSSSIVSK